MRGFAAPYEVELRLLEPGGDGEKELWALGDRQRLLQVMANLLSNAVKFSPRGSEVRLAASRREGRVAVEVSDRGPGIPEEFRGRLFEQFTQLDSSPTRPSGGSGLGLSIVKGMMDGMGGEIEVDSRLGEGTVFRLLLPAVAPPLPETVPAARPVFEP
jgi:signal transduction histidine kinase